MSLTPSTVTGSGPYAVYIMRDSEGRALYVGATSSVTQRINAHAGKPWFSLVASVEVTRCSSAEGLRHLETMKIQTELPAHNVARRSNMPHSGSHVEGHLTYSEAADALGVTVRTLHRYIEDGLLVPTRVQITPRSTAPRLAASDVERIKTAAVA